MDKFDALVSLVSVLGLSFDLYGFFGLTLFFFYFVGGPRRFMTDDLITDGSI
jgi:hypothetical protein